MMTDPNTRAYMKVGDEWVELPRLENGFAIDPPQVLGNGQTLTIKYDCYPYGIAATLPSFDDPSTPIYVNYPPPDLPDGATITKASIDLDAPMPRGRFGDVWGISRDEEE